MAYDCCPDTDTCSCKDDSSKFLRGNRNFPILYKDERLIVYKNPLGEIFIESNYPHSVGLHIQGSINGLIVTASKGTLTPTSVSGQDAFRVSDMILRH